MKRDWIIRPRGLPETPGSLRRTSQLGFSSHHEFLEQIKDKVVLDLGSGSGNFAREVYSRLGRKTCVISMNPRLALQEYRETHEIAEKTFLIQAHLLWKDEQQKQFVLERYSQTAVAADWDDLPFASESFDFIFATGNLLFYDGTYSDSLFSSLLLLLKKGMGQIRIELCQSDRYELVSAEKVAEKHGCTVFLNKDFFIAKRT